MDKTKNLAITFLVIAIAVIGIIYYAYSRKGETPMNNGGTIQQPSGEESGTNFKGPTGEPYIKGPGELPPTSE